MNGSHVDSSTYDVQLMHERSYVLCKKLENIVQRRGYDFLCSYLPEKREYVVKVCLTKLQASLIDGYLTGVISRGGFGGKGTGRPTSLLMDFQTFKKICIHPAALELHRLESKMKEDNNAIDSDDSLKDFMVDGSEEENGASGLETREIKTAK